jgi:predicted dehydrogenase
MNLIFYGFRHGHILGCYLQAAENKNVEILAAIEENDQARASAEKNLDISISADGYDHWLSNPAVDAVAIGGAYGDRGQAIIKALKAGKHILADKPLCTHMAELEQISALSAEKNLKIGCLLDLRKMPATAQVKSLLNSGRLGKVKSIGFTGQHCIDYANRPTWYFEPGKHGGTINDIAIHAIDLIPYLTGENIRKAYCARTWNAFATRNPDFNDSAMFLAETNGGISISADVSYAAPSQVFTMPTYWNFQLWCEKGLITFRWADTDVTVYEDGKTAPETLPGIPATTTILDDFLVEIRDNTNTFTNAVLTASETALRLQKLADETKDRGVSL